MTPSVDTAATALWDYSSQHSAPDFLALEFDQCNCPAEAHPNLINCNKKLMSIY